MKILFICTHNRCRSILCEAITNNVCGELVHAFSAGSQPEGQVHPKSLQALQLRGIDTSHLKSQSWDDFDGISFDAVITVCDSAAGESCPLWMGNTPKVHWGLPDPSKSKGTDAQIMAKFDDLIQVIEKRAKRLSDLASASHNLSGDALIKQLNDIEESEPV